MRMSNWTPEIVRFMEDAARQSPYFRQLAEVAASLCPRGGRILDAGCGMGQLSLELAGHAGRIDAVDCSAEAIRYLEGVVERDGVRNVRPLCADMFALGPTAPVRGRLAWQHRRLHAGVRRRHAHNGYDLAIFCLSASFEDAYAAAARMGAKRVLVINKIHAHNPYESRPVVDDFERCLEANRSIDARCRGTRMRLDYGQPLRSLDDAVAYFGLFRTRTYPLGVTREQVEGLIERRNDPAFPYYLPVWRDLAVFSCEVDARAARGVGCDGRWDALYSTPASRSAATACILE